MNAVRHVFSSSACDVPYSNRNAGSVAAEGGLIFITEGTPSRLFSLPWIAARLPMARRFAKFCLVGGSGLCVDMVFLFLFADPRCLGLGVVASKILSAEMGMINNFIWNELWTFRQPGGGKRHEAPLAALRAEPVARNRGAGLFRSFMLFHLICGAGVGFAVLLLYIFHTLFGWNLYLSNLLAIVLVTFWNFGLNTKFNWRIK